LASFIALGTPALVPKLSMSGWRGALAVAGILMSMLYTYCRVKPLAKDMLRKIFRPAGETG
jgi:hypothetical protein